MTTKPPPRLPGGTSIRRRVAVFKGDRFWVVLDGRGRTVWAARNDRAFRTHAEAVEYAFRLAQTTEVRP